MKPSFVLPTPQQQQAQREKEGKKDGNDDDELLNWGMVDQRKKLNLIYNRDYYQRFSPLQISDMWQSGLEPTQNLSLGFVEDFVW